MDSGRRIHVPVLKCRIPFSICKELGEFLLSWQVGQAKNHPRRSRHYKAFQGILPITQKSSQKSTTTCGLASARCVFNGSLSIFFGCADEVRRGTDGGIYLLVSCVFGVVACLRRLCWLDLCSCSLLGPLVCWDEGQQGQTICHCGTVRPATVTHSQPASWPTDQP